MDITKEGKNQHLLWRAGFGPSAGGARESLASSPHALFKSLDKSSARSPHYIEIVDHSANGLMLGLRQVSSQTGVEAAEEKKRLLKQSQQEIQQLNLAWIQEMISGEDQLREKMALFWHGHFASRNLNVFYQQLLLDIIRQNALGRFSDMLYGVSKSAAMLHFLNNMQNRKDHPNENFAREVMELFTMGRGHYSEQDVKEAARAFTGWSANPGGEFLFHKFQHDAGVKSFLGRSGNFDGDDILAILLEEKQTARFISTKIYRFFVNDEPDAEHVEWLSERFFQSHYDIRRLMEDLFTSEWFYEPRNLGTRIKSPVEWMVGIRRMLPMTLQNENSQIQIQRLLGQLLFYPPNVAGWPGGLNWIDSSSLMFRLQIPQILYQGNEWSVNAKADDDQEMGMRESMDDPARKAKGKNGQSFRASIDWESYFRRYDGIPDEELVSAVLQTLVPAARDLHESTVRKYMDRLNRESLLKTATIQIMSTPEYQMC